VEEYSGFKGDDKIRLHTETMFGEKTPEVSKKLQNAVDSQADFNLVSVYLIGVISTAVFFAILSLCKTAKKIKICWTFPQFCAKITGNISSANDDNVRLL
jgi:hypothetical protein